ncbi:MAG: choice-of-anchor D domain-containing protein, partial [Blastocatellia bacterium]
GATWEVYGLGLPNVYCSALALDYDVTPSVLRVGTYGRSVFELSAAEGPLLGINANAAFGDVCVGRSETREVQLFNVGSSDLHINSFFRLSGSADFQLVSGPAVPVTIRPGSHLNFTIRFSPGSAGNKTAIFQINSDDLVQPSRQLAVSGNGVTQRIATLVADSGNFGGVCLDSFKDLGLTISNSGACDLSVSNITLTPGTDFLLPGVLSYPLVIHAGDSIEVPIRFQPASKGGKSATVRIFSDDPATPVKTVSVSGVGLAPSIITNDPITFDKTCPGQTNNKTLTIGNSGLCDLIVKSITSDSPEFKVVGVVPFPLIIPPGSTRDVTIQFMPMGFTVDPMRMAKLTIMSNDPDTPNKMVKVIGIVPPPVIQAMPDPLDFGKVCLGKSKELPLTIKNNGECNLTVSSIMFSSAEFKLVPLPTFPFVVPPGGSR